ncbi:MAG: pyridoxal phosphate-dependent aminotransferase [bacterium]|nr:pyridoxal phosphate-dependent aminotransferase [bacterium]
MRLASRMQNLSASPTLAMNARAAAMRAAGIDVISFAAGEPDFDTPGHIKEAAIQALRDGQTKYTDVRGILPLREAICDWVSEHKGLQYVPDDVIVTVGGKQAVFNAFYALLQEGDEIILPVPAWVSYAPIAVLAGATVVPVRTREENDFKMTREELEAAVSPRTRAIVLNSPSNPTGSVYRRAELEMIAEVILPTQAIIIADEIYGKLLYEGEAHVSIASLSPEVKARTLLLDGFAKTYAMTGWRMGYALGPQEIIKAMNKLQGQSTSNATTFCQYGGVAALRGPHDFLEGWCAEYDRRRKTFVEGLGRIPGLSVSRPKGAFYVFPRVSRLFGKKGPQGELKNSVDVGLYFLENARCAGVPGEGFKDDDFIRFSYATSIENVKEGIERLRAAVEQLG